MIGAVRIQINANGICFNTWEIAEVNLESVLRFHSILKRRTLYVV